ncbi:MAG: hypothetical protein JSS07_10845 [Proteobacteria bacterium]|nr:hypothetical protein [Pseudomonadota bacterium]
MLNGNSSLSNDSAILTEIMAYLSSDESQQISLYLQRCQNFEEFANDSIFWKPYLDRLAKINPLLVSINEPISLARKFLEGTVKTINQQNEECKIISDYHSKNAILKKELATISIFIDQNKSLSQLENLDQALDVLNEKIILSRIKMDSNELKINKMHLTRFPAKLFSNQLSAFWQSVEHIICVDNHFHFLPVELFQHTSSLRSFNCTRNKLKYLPMTIGNSKNLEGLNCSENQLQELPDSLAECTSMSMLLASDNQIKNLAENLLKNWKNLKDLRFDGNKLSSLPNNITSCTNLTRLEFAGNELTTFPDLSNCLLLEICDISFNKIEILNNMILPKIKQFHCVGNLLKELPQYLSSKFGSDWCESILNPNRAILDPNWHKIVRHCMSPTSSVESSAESSVESGNELSGSIEPVDEMSDSDESSSGTVDNMDDIHMPSTYLTTYARKRTLRLKEWQENFSARTENMELSFKKKRRRAATV